MNIEHMESRRRTLLGPAYRLFYQEPLHIVRGDDVWLFDDQGKRYLDAYNNVPHVGHCNRHVVEQVSRQAGTLNTHTRYLHDNILDLSEQLITHLPDGNWHAMYACSGTEANDLALRMAQTVTGSRGIIVTSFAYHGHSIAIAPISTDSVPDGHEADHVETIPAPQTYRFPGSEEEALAHYLDQLDQAIENLARKGHGLAACFLDTIMSSEGLPTVPKGFMKAAAERVRKAGGYFIADEVQAGLGRLGENFFGFQRQGARPDMVTLGKPLGNGFPVSCVLARAELVEAFSDVFHYFNTFAGNPVACAAALAVQDELRERALQTNASEQGNRLCQGFRELAKRHELIGDIRGDGLFLGIELVTDRDEKTPAPKLARNIMNRMKAEGVLLGVTGLHDNVLKIRPPLTFTQAHGELLLSVFEQVLTDTAP